MKEKILQSMGWKKNVSGTEASGISKKIEKLLPEGVYFYILDLGDGRRKSLKGYVYLRRRD